MTVTSRLRRAARICIAGAIASIGLATTGTAHAQAWPTKTVRMVVPVGAGGTTDIISRLLAEAMQKSTGQTFIVDLKPGANGLLAAQDLNSQPADGHTLYLGTVSQNGVAPAVLPKLGFGPEDFTPIARLADSNIVVLVSPKADIKTVKDLVDRAKAKPGELNYYSTGQGSYAHLAAEMLAFKAGVKMTHVPYKGFAQGFPDMAAGLTHMSHDAIGSTLPYIKDGRLVAVAVTGPTRSPALPDVPTIGEAFRQIGLPPYSTNVWFGLFGPKGMSADLARRISDEFNKALKSPEVTARFATLYVEAASTTPAEFARFVNAEIESYRKLAKDVNFKAE